MGVTMRKVTISGHPGSGTSTLVDGLVRHFDCQSVNGGEIFRNEAKSRGLSLAEFGTLCSNDETIDRELDEQLKQHIADEITNIIESRLAGWWAFKMNADCIRIWLKVTELERAKRVSVREKVGLNIALQENSNRLSVDNKRYEKMYGFVPDDPTPYTHIIDATDISAEQVLEVAIKIIEGV